MRDVNVESITTSVQETWKATPDPRLKYLLQQAVASLHDYARKVRLTHEEWNGLLRFVSACGQVSDDRRNEFSLLSDVFGLTSLTDLLNATPGATTGSVLGPFYVEGSPALPRGGDLAENNDGDVVLVSGKVTDTNGTPIKGAVIDMWQADDKGIYATQDPAQSDDAFRCQQDCDETGAYWFTTVLPAPYSIPTDGPVGELFRTAGRSPWRPGHYHFIVRAPGHRSIVTEVFFSHDKFIDSDAVFGVRKDLICEVKDISKEKAPSPLERVPNKQVNFDFILVPVESI